MNAAVTLRGPDGLVHELVPGDIIGRTWAAALLINDGRVSEAHAMVSLREGELQLVGLRGGFAVDGRPLSQATLLPGMQVQLARDVVIEVLSVRLPDRVLGIEGRTLARQALPGVCSVVVDPGPRLVRGWVEDAAAHLWWADEGWWARAPGGEARAVAAGDVLLAGAEALVLVDLPLRAAGPLATRRSGEFDAPLTVVARFHTAHIQRDGAVIVSLSGQSARVISELVSLGGPVGWVTLSELLWPELSDPALRRPRLDVLLSRLRARLRAAGVRDDLVRSDGAGQVELLIHPRDTLVDET